MCPLDLQHMFYTHTHERAQYNTHRKPGHYPLATDCNTLQRNPEQVHSFQKKLLSEFQTQLVPTSNMISQDLKRNNILLEILAYQVHFLLQDTYCSH